MYVLRRGRANLKKPSKHDLKSLSASLVKKGVDKYITVISIMDKSVIVKDEHYGVYTVDLKSFCDSTAFPMHKGRRHAQKMKRAGEKVIGKKINGVTIKDLFYGPDRGYRNRSFYVEIDASCGHTAITTIAAIKKHRPENTKCADCGKIEHGARAKDKGTRIQRTGTYTKWQSLRPSLPPQLQEFADFRRILGDKPAPRADVIFTPEGPKWSVPTLTADKELNAMASALRQAFRQSELYKACLERARVETEEGTRYRCALCNGLFKKTHVQVDHIEPVAPIDGSPLLRETLIDRVWTEKIQILDKACHNEKSARENAERRRLKKERNK